MIEVDKRFYHEDNYYNNDIYGEYREDIKQYINEYKTCEYDKIIEKRQKDKHSKYIFRNESKCYKMVSI